MMDRVKKRIYLSKVEFLVKKGIVGGLVTDFNEEFYKKLSQNYIAGMPISMLIKYTSPEHEHASDAFEGRCETRSLYMFFCLENATLVSGNLKHLELLHGKEAARHFWIEIDSENSIYEPNTLKKYNRDLFYAIYMPTDVIKQTKDEFCADPGNKETYDLFHSRKIEDLQPGGHNRKDLLLAMPMLYTTAKKSGNDAFVRDVEEYMDLVQYDEDEIMEEMRI